MNKKDVIMQLSNFDYPKWALTLIMFASICNADDLPAGFPPDIPIPDYADFTSSTNFDGNRRVTFNAAGKSVPDVVTWFKEHLSESGWSLDSELVTDTNAILPFTKDGRKCGVSITDFVLNRSGQMDRTIKGITLQISGKPKPSTDAAASSIDAAGEASL